jgi:hypothetical protein
MKIRANLFFLLFFGGALLAKVSKARDKMDRADARSENARTEKP